MITRNTTENLGEILLNEPMYPFLSRAPTMTPNKGKPIPVNEKAMIAGQKKRPLSCPRLGGNIRFPAPKNIANKVKPIIQVFLFMLLLLFICKIAII